MFVEIPLFSSHDGARAKSLRDFMLGRQDIQPNDATNYDANDDSNWDLGEREVTDGGTHAFLDGAIGSLDFFDVLILGGDIKAYFCFESLVLDTLGSSVHVDLLDGESSVGIGVGNGNETLQKSIRCRVGNILACAKFQMPRDGDGKTDTIHKNNTGGKDDLAIS